MPPKKTKPSKQETEKKNKAEGKWLYSLNHYTGENFRALFSLKKADKEDPVPPERADDEQGNENYSQVNLL